MLKQVQHDEAARQFPTPFPPFHRLRPIVSKRTFAWHGICPRGAVLQLKCLVPSPDRTSPTIWKPPPESRPQAASSGVRSEEHTSELQSLMRISYAVCCLKKKLLSLTIINLSSSVYPQQRH